MAEFIDATTLGGLRPSAFADRIAALTAPAKSGSATFRDLAKEANKFYDVNGGPIEPASFSVAASKNGAGDAENVSAF